MTGFRELLHHIAFVEGAAAGAPDQSFKVLANPAVSERQRRFFGAVLGRSRAGKKRKGDPPEGVAKEFARKPKARSARKRYS